MPRHIYIDEKIPSFNKTIKVSSDKSLSIRTILLASQAVGTSRISNLLEYIFALDPLNQDPKNLLPQVTRDDKGIFLTYTILKSLDDYKVRVQVSNDLSNWRYAPDEVVYQVITEGDIMQTVRASLQFNFSDDDSSRTRFMRITVN